MTSYSNEDLCMMLDSCTFNCEKCAYNHQTREEGGHKTGYMTIEELRGKYPEIVKEGEI